MVTTASCSVGQIDTGASILQPLVALFTQFSSFLVCFSSFYSVSEQNYTSQFHFRPPPSVSLYLNTVTPLCPLYRCTFFHVLFLRKYKNVALCNMKGVICPEVPHYLVVFTAKLIMNFPLVRPLKMSVWNCSIESEYNQLTVYLYWSAARDVCR